MSTLEGPGAAFRSHPRAADLVLALMVFLLALVIRPDGPTPIGAETPVSILLLGSSCCALVFRRQFPLPVWAVTTVIAVAGVVVADGPSAVVLPTFVGVYTVASHRDRWLGIGAALGSALAMIGALVVTESSALSSPTTYAVLAWGGMAAAIGVAVRSQRAVVAAAELRARQAEDSRDEQARRAVTEERLRIARELHDVVAHHVSVINVQAGVARHLLSQDPEQAAEALRAIRESSQLVLTEMSTMLGLLRNPDEASATAPVPGMAGVDALIDSVRRSGMKVTLRTTGTPESLPPLADLTVYRLIQEALTNARKHGTGVADVSLDYRDSQIVLDVDNPVAAEATEPGAGHGLIGMKERVAAAGGRLAITTESGIHRLHVELPVPAIDTPPSAQVVGR